MSMNTLRNTPSQVEASTSAQHSVGSCQECPVCRQGGDVEPSQLSLKFAEVGLRA